MLHLDPISKQAICIYVCIKYARLSLAYIVTFTPHIEKERERVLAYVSVLGESRGRRIKEEARLGARRFILASQA